eukprot:m.212989 g.212989  ORF g.212989 m.212989 type:complete len:127 (-) comp26328_c0_seq1:193-573(-)
MAERIVNDLAAQEKLAEEVMSERYQVVQLDARRNENRVALGQLRRHALAKTSRVWINVGSAFLLFPREDAERIIEADQVELTTAIESSRASSQAKAKQLQAKEGRQMSKGWDLKPMARSEMSGPAL